MTEAEPALEEEDFDRLVPLEEDNKIECVSEENMFVGHECSPPKTSAKFVEANNKVEIGCGPDNNII